jgi:hypothetical protein
MNIVQIDEMDQFNLITQNELGCMIGTLWKKIYWWNEFDEWRWSHWMKQNLKIGGWLDPIKWTKSGDIRSKEWDECNWMKILMHELSWQIIFLGWKLFIGWSEFCESRHWMSLYCMEQCKWKSKLVHEYDAMWCISNGWRYSGSNGMNMMDE